MDGLVPGSCAWRFYRPGGYQDVGLTYPVGPTTNSGLVASTTYQFNITADGGSAYALSFTTDSSNLTMASGANSVLSKIQDALDLGFKTSGSNLEGKQIRVFLHQSDIRFERVNNAKTAAVLLADSSGSDTDLWGVGVFPAVGDIKPAVAKQLEPTEEFGRDGRNIIPSEWWLFDDGRGNICHIRDGKVGTIDYQSGKHQFQTNRYKSANFVVYANAGSGLSQSSLNMHNNIKDGKLQVLHGNMTDKPVDFGQWQDPDPQDFTENR